MGTTAGIAGGAGRGGPGLGDETAGPGGANAANYALGNTNTSTTAAITAQLLVVTATGVNKVYDGTTTATAILADNRVAGDVLTDSYGSANFTSSSIQTA